MSFYMLKAFLWLTPCFSKSKVVICSAHHPFISRSLEAKEIPPLVNVKYEMNSHYRNDPI